MESVEDIERRSFLPVGVKPRCLQLKHCAVAPSGHDQLFVRAELDDFPVLEYANAIGMADCREAVRDQNRSGVSRGGEDAVEDLGLAAHVELGGGLIEQYQAGAGCAPRTSASESHALPLPAG